MTAAAMRMRRCWLGVATSALAIALPGAVLAQMSGMGGGMDDTRAHGQLPGGVIDPSFAYRDGVAQLKAGRYRQAEEDFEHVLDAAPDNGDVLLLYGLSKEGQGDLKGAARAYESAVRREPDNIIAHQQLGLALVRLNQSDRAKAELDLLQKKAAACHDACADAGRLKTAVAAMQGAMGAPAGS